MLKIFYPKTVALRRYKVYPGGSPKNNIFSNRIFIFNLVEPNDLYFLNASKKGGFLTRGEKGAKATVERRKESFFYIF